MKLLLFVSLILTSFTVQAGVFRPGKVFPLFRRQVNIEPRNPTPATPNPPPIVNPFIPPLVHVPPVPPISTKITEEEVQEIIKVLSSSNNDSETPISNLPPWLPLGGVAGGGLLTLLGFARRGFSLSRGD